MNSNVRSSKLSTLQSTTAQEKNIDNPSNKSKLFKQGYTNNGEVKLVRSGKAYFDLLLQLIAKAKEVIHLQMYIFYDDETGTMVAEALIAAADRNVKVYVMADGYASQWLSRHFIRRMKEAGIQFKFFEPLLKSKHFYFGRRMHYKVLVVDNSYALVGGINISNHYNDTPGSPAWLDFALYVEGHVAQDMNVFCWKTWRGFTRSGKARFSVPKIDFPAAFEKNYLVRVRCNDWVRKKNQISRSYLDILSNANEYITIMSSYFLPGRIFRKKIIAAGKRGVKMRVVLAGRSDVYLAKQAERYIYRWLLKNSVEIFEFKPNVLHGKMAFYDDTFTTVGSYNFNFISAYASIELNLDVYNAEFTKKVRAEVEKIIQEDCEQITADYVEHHSHFLVRSWQRICLEVIRFIFFVFTFYFKQRD